MNILFKSLHVVNHLENFVQESANNSVPDSYIRAIIKEVEKKKGTKRYVFKSATVEARTLVDNFFNRNFNEHKGRFPEKLIPIERERHQQIRKLKKGIKEGVLFQIVYEVDAIWKFIIVKSDNLGFFDNQNFELRSGLPKEKKVFKAFLLEKSSEKEELFVYLPGTAKYWWDTFLDLQEFQSNEKNTETAFLAIERKINKLRRYAKFEQEHRLLKNALIGYFRTKPSFSILEVAEQIENFVPLDNSILGELKPILMGISKAVLELPQKKEFDSVFKIAATAIPSRRIVEKIGLRPNLSLHILGNIERLEKVILPYKKDGEKHIIIKTQDGYKRFGGK